MRMMVKPDEMAPRAVVPLLRCAQWVWIALGLVAGLAGCANPSDAERPDRTAPQVSPSNGSTGLEAGTPVAAPQAPSAEAPQPGPGLDLTQTPTMPSPTVPPALDGVTSADESDEVGTPDAVDSPQVGELIERGRASWYGRRFQGRRTASGEPFDMHALTAAHKTLPFGTLVRVRSLRNGREVVVRINDRGPYAKGRVIDLSQAAMAALKLRARGVIRVELLRE